MNKSLKKFKDKKFSGLLQDMIAGGRELLGWELDRLLGTTRWRPCGQRAGHPGRPCRGRSRALIL